MSEARRRLLTQREREFLNQLAMIDEGLHDYLTRHNVEFTRALIRSTDRMMLNLNQTRVDENNGERTQGMLPITWSKQGG